MKRKKTIKYIGFFDVYENCAENRNVEVAAHEKMLYVADLLQRTYGSVTIVSVCSTRNRRFYTGKTAEVSENISLRLFPTLPWGRRPLATISNLFSKACLYLYLLFNTRRHDPVVVYHSNFYQALFLSLKKIKRFTLILEVEELYHDVSKLTPKEKKLEYKIINNADRYIFSTEMLADKLNGAKKPYTVINGSLKPVEIVSPKFSDGKIHAVYAGILEKKKGCFAAINAAKYLGVNYHIHIIGHGNSDEVKAEIERISTKAQCTVTFDGLLKEKEYIKFLQKCHIGLCTQDLDADFNVTSFPSKILSYMANGLEVVSVPVPAVVNSAVGKYIHFCASSDAAAVADAITSVDRSIKISQYEVFKKLDEKCEEEIKQIITSILPGGNRNA